MRVLKLLIKYFKIELARQMSYRVSFIFTLIGTFFVNLIGPLFSVLLYSSTSGIPGWRFGQFLLMQGILIFVFGVNHTFVELTAFKTSLFIQIGIFDNILVRPYNSLLQMITTSLDIDGVAQLATGLIIILFAFNELNLVFNPLNILLFIIFILVAILFMFSITTMAASLSFYVVKSFIIIELIHSLRQFGRYPISIYGGLGTLLFSFIFPIGLAAFYPAQSLLGKINLVSSLALIIVGMLFFLLSIFMWNTAIKHYTSAGG